MSNFWIAACLTLTALSFDSLYGLLSFEAFYVKARSFVNWLPIGVVWAFLSGYYYDLVSAKSNELGRGTVVFAVLAVEYFLGYVLQRNLFVLKSPWRQADMPRLRNASLLIYAIMLVAALLPFVMFRDITGVNFWVFSFLLLLVFYGPYWQRVQNAASEDISNQLQLHLRSYCQRSVLEFSEADEDSRVLLNGTFSELVALLDSTCKSLEHVMIFRPVQKSGELVPALENGVLPLKSVKAICKEVQTAVLVELSMRRAKLTLLLGTDAQAEEKLGEVAKKSSKELAEQLFQRRKILSANREAHAADIERILRPPILG